jgi:hypothetical protein
VTITVLKEKIAFISFAPDVIITFRHGSLRIPPPPTVGAASFPGEGTN